jgi:hypothetical protein
MTPGLGVEGGHRERRECRNGDLDGTAVDIKKSLIDNYRSRS